MSIIGLKTCPFCEGEGRALLVSGWWYVACRECEASTARTFNTEEEAVEAWNGRPADRDLDNLRRQLRVLIGD